MWTEQGLLIVPINVAAGAKEAIAQAFVNLAGLETLENELLMFDKASVFSDDFGSTATHCVVRTAIFSELANAILSIIPGSDNGLWYVLDANNALLTTNDPKRLDDDIITHNLDWSGDGIVYNIGIIVRHNNTIYECIQMHTSQPDWVPISARSLWKRYRTLGEVLEWTQPIGATDAYPLGARVLHGGYIYASLISNNVWEPGVAGSETLWSCENCPSPPGWAVGVLYYVNDEVIYEDMLYRCLQQHTSISVWYPSAPGVLNVLWQVVGPV